MQTICPHCQTVFKIADEQLKAADGYVRCGICKEVFNALETDLPGEEAATETEITNTAETAIQKEIERRAFNAGGGNWSVPGQNLFDFLNNKSSKELNINSYKMGAVSADLRALFPEFIIKQLLEAFEKWKEELPLFISREAVLLGPETRTSSPVRILRNSTFESINTKNLYPIGEGSGHSGGISSSAADAIVAVRAVLGLSSL